MTKRRFGFGGSGEMVPVQRDSPEQRLEWAAAERLAGRGGRIEIIVETDAGSFRNLGEFDLDDFADPDEFWEYLDDYMGGDEGDGGYFDGGAVGVSVVSR